MPAGGTLVLPDFEIVAPTRVVQRHQLTARQVAVDVGGIGITSEDPAEPVLLDLGHVTNQAVKRQLRSCNRKRLPARVVQALALQQQRCAVELEPVFQHLPLRQDEIRFLTTRIFRGDTIFKHFDDLTQDDYQYGFDRKFLAQIRLVELGQHAANDGASITLSSGFLPDYPNPASLATGPLNAAVDAYVRSAAPLLQRGIRLNVVSPAPVVDEGQEAHGAITADQAAAAYIEAIDGDFTGQVLRPWGGLPHI